LIIVAETDVYVEASSATWQHALSADDLNIEVREKGQNNNIMS